MTSRPKLHPLALALAACGLSQGAAAADASIEERIARLEATIAELKAELAASKAAPVAAAPAAAAAPATATPVIQSTPILVNALPNSKFSAGGFIKLDAMATRTDGGEIADASAGRTFYLPSATPVGGTQESTDLDMHAQFSRLWFAADSTLDSGDKLRGYLEFDLFGGALGTEAATNTYGLTVRHAWASWNEWMAGQTWSNFQDPAALPDSVDFIGPTEGTVFVRQAQVRYTKGPWSFSAENPETVYTPTNGGANRISSDDNNMPDFTARYTTKGDWGHFSIGALLRQLKYDTAGALSDATLGGGVSASGRYVLSPSDDLRYMVTAGRGIGRYVGLALDTDATLLASGELSENEVIAGFLGWRHVFSPQWRGNLFGSFAEFDHHSAAGGGATASAHSLHANLIYSPVPKFDVGAELILADRELESGADGDLQRLHVHVKYNF
jgi:hypothetical protein